VLALLARREDRDLGRLPARTRWTAALAGAFFACDLVLWHHTIDAVGAGLATVLGNLQVLVVAVVAWWLLGERPHAGLVAPCPVLLLGRHARVRRPGRRDVRPRPPPRRAARPRDLGGVRRLPARAALRLRDLRRLAGPLLWASASAAACAALLGALLGELALPDARSLAWLAVLAVTAQVCGWLLITSSLPPPAGGAHERAAARPARRRARRVRRRARRGPDAVQLGGAARSSPASSSPPATRPRAVPVPA
jgi:hypothetical protein